MVRVCVTVISTGPAAGVGVPSVDHHKPNIFATSSGLDDFDEGQEEMEACDFADEVRRKITDEFTNKQQISGFEVGPEPLIFCSH